MTRSTIANRGERALVAAADAVLRPLSLRRGLRRRPEAPARILVLRLERIGDLLITLPAIAALRAAYPNAAIDLVVGSWNRELASAISGIDRVEAVDASWLARESGGEGVARLIGRAAQWRTRTYDLGINFEPDIRSNAMLAASGAGWTAGYASGGGGPLLDLALDYEPTKHAAENASALVEAITGAASPRIQAALSLPAASRVEADTLLARFGAAPKVGMHISGGRAIKQWPVARFRDVAAHLVRDRGAALIVTGTPADRDDIESLRADVPPDRLLDLSCGTNLLIVAAVLERLDVFISGDTGPMHLAHAVGTPVVAVFGPSDPRRYAPRGTRDRVVRIDLPCSPCNRIRQPPARCVGHTPDCLAGIAAADVLDAVAMILPRSRSGAAG